MRIYIKSLIVFLAVVNLKPGIYSQIQPINGDTLNFIHVLFTFPWEPEVEKYKVTIWDKKNPDKKIEKETRANKLIVKELSFNTQYNWNYVALDANNKPISTSSQYVFYTANSALLDTLQVRYRVIKNLPAKTNDGVIFFDYGRVAIDRTGKPVWFLPNLPETGSGTLRNLGPTSAGNIMFLYNNNYAVEIDLQGNIKWRAPNDGSVAGEKNESYHHDFKKLDNGNYMILGDCHVKKCIPGKRDSATITYGTIIEYTSEGKVAWSWNSKDYFPDEYIFLNKTGNETNDRDMHMNAFYANDKYVYAGFKNISNIIKIDKASKKVVASYGDGYQSSNHYGKGFFRLQHDVYMLSNGNIAVVNNDSVSKPDVYSGLVIFSEATEKDPTSKKTFEFSFRFDTLTTGKSGRLGNLVEMKNGNILVNMGGVHRAIEITQKKEVVWDAFIERYEGQKKQWTAFPQYRLAFESSLYPYCFSAKTKMLTSRKGERTVQGEVWNIGSENDMYTLIVKQEGKQIFTKVITKTVTPGRSSKFKVAIPVNGSNLQYEVFIYSGSGIGEKLILQ